MGRNTTGGNKQKKGKNSTQDSKKRPLTYADNKDTLYALVISPLGDCGFLVHCSDNVERIGIIRGAMYKSSFIQSGDMTLISLREFEQVKLGRKERCDVLLKYHAEEVSQLVKRGLYYKDSVRPFLTKLEKGKSTKFDHQNPSSSEAADDDIITTVTTTVTTTKKTAGIGGEGGDDDDGDDDSKFLLAKEDLNDFYGSQKEEDKDQDQEEKIQKIKKIKKIKEIMKNYDNKEEEEEDDDKKDDKEEEEEEEELDCFGNCI